MQQSCSKRAQKEAETTKTFVKPNKLDEKKPTTLFETRRSKDIYIYPDYLHQEPEYLVRILAA